MSFEDWDACEYIDSLVKKNKLAKDGEFKFARVSGLANLEEVVSNMRKFSAFVAVDDTAEFSTSFSGSGYFEHKVYTVFVLCRYKVNDMEDMKRAVLKCKSVGRSIISRIIVDAEKLRDALIYIDDEISGRDVGNALLNGLTGFYFSFSFALPQDLSVISDEWDD